VAMIKFYSIYQNLDFKMPPFNLSSSHALPSIFFLFSNPYTFFSYPFFLQLSNMNALKTIGSRLSVKAVLPTVASRRKYNDYF
jgi:hypothetical protein